MPLPATRPRRYKLGLMLTLYHSCAEPGERPADLAKASLPANVAWIDLLKPEPDEVAFVERTTGLDVPSIEDLSEIESSSRLRNQKRRDLSECAARFIAPTPTSR